MPDDTVLWLAADANSPRAVYEATLLYEAWVEPRGLEGANAYRMTFNLLYPGGHWPIMKSTLIRNPRSPRVSRRGLP
jgi:hypothetical protein